MSILDEFPEGLEKTFSFGNESDGGRFAPWDDKGVTLR